MKHDIEQLTSGIQKAYDADLPEDVKKEYEKIGEGMLKESDYDGLILLLIYVDKMMECDYLFPIKKDLIETSISQINKGIIIDNKNSEERNQDRMYLHIFHYLAWMTYKYDATFYSIHAETSPNIFEIGKIAFHHRKAAYSSLDFMASMSVKDFEWVSEGEDSVIFGYDLLSFIGMQMKEYALLYSYYRKTGNRTAACYCKIKEIIDKVQRQEQYMKFQQVIDEYGDLPIICLAIEYICRENLLPEYGKDECCNSSGYDDYEEDYDYGDDDFSADDVRFSDENIQKANEYTNAKRNLLLKYISKFPASEYIDRLKNLCSQMETSCFTTSRFEQILIPGQSLSMRVRMRNVNSLTLSLYPLMVDSLELTRILDARLAIRSIHSQGLSRMEILGQYASKTASYSKSWEYREESYLEHREEIGLSGIAKGIYMVEVTSDTGKSSMELLYVSSVTAIAECISDSETRIVVLDNHTGHPIPYAKVKAFTSDSNSEILLCNADGETVMTVQSSVRSLIPFTDDDRFCMNMRKDGYGAGYRFYQDELKKHVEIFTDRSIYRPGQKVHVAIVNYCVYGNHCANTIAKELTVSFSKRRSYYSYSSDNNGINQVKVSTDQYGVASLDFDIPEDSDSGTYYIECADSMKKIQVEEYKRPTFEVTIDDYTKQYKVGDTIVLEGNAIGFNGIPVANAQVKVQLKRSTAWWWQYMSRYWEMRLDRYSCRERDLRNFTTTTDERGHFNLEVPMTLSSSNCNRPLFENIIVEVQVVDSTGESQMGCKSLPLSNRDHVMRIDVKDKMDCSGETFKAVLLNSAGKEMNADLEYWLDDGKSSVISSNEPVSLAVAGIGKHTLHLKYDGEEVRREFVLLDLDAETIPVETDEWAYQSADIFPENGDAITLQVGSSSEDVYLVYDIFSGPELIESGAKMVSSGMLNWKLGYESKYGHGIFISFGWVKDRKLHRATFSIRQKTLDHHSLRYVWKTFRDRVEPGTSEKWTLSIMDKEGNGVDANIIATLYDKSLDMLKPNLWNFTCYDSPWKLAQTRWDLCCMETASLMFKGDSRCDAFQHLHLNSWKLFSGEDNKNVQISHESCYMSEDCSESPLPSIGCSGASCLDLEHDEVAPETSEEPISSDIRLRSDMSEIAFFYPMLRTNVDGSVDMEFTLPDSLTTWKLNAIAFTRELYWTEITGETIARKKVMVQPNMPRFVRVGDNTTITAKITNTSDESISGKVIMELLQAEDETILLKESMDFSIETGKSIPVTFTLTPDEEVREYICKVYAVGNGFSDGEQHSLEVLSDKRKVCVTRAISQDGSGTIDVNTGEMIPDGSTRRHLAFDYVNSPVWLAIKALPAMRTANPENALDIVFSLYSNLMSSYLRKQAYDLGNIDLPEGNDLKASTNQLIEKLKDLQCDNGGFRWYKEMPASFHMTTEILMHLCRLVKMIGNVDGLDSIISSAMAYCCQEICSCVSELREREEKGYNVYLPTFSMLQHMYNIALYEYSMDNDVEDNYGYLVALLRKDIHDQTMREKAMSAVIFEYAGKHELALSYVESLRQYTKLGENGRTFDTPRASYSWYSYKIPTHVAGMEAIHTLCPEDKQTIKEMQKWLLEEKRTQMWETGIDTINSVHMLLVNAEKTMSEKCKTMVLADNNALELSVQGEECMVSASVPADTKTLSFQKESDGLSWGSVYADFLQPLKDVSASGTGMEIKREIIKPREELHVGDKIRVKLTYSCSRDFDFVTITDSKAACMEPVNQLSSKDSFVHISPLDKETRYSYYGIGKGVYSIETEFFLDRAGEYEIGCAEIVCTYAPAFRAICPSEKLRVLP